MSGERWVSAGAVLLSVLAAVGAAYLLVRAWRRARMQLVPGASRWFVAETALAQSSSRIVARLLVGDVRSNVALYRWLTRRRPPGQRFGYSKANRNILWTLVAITVLEGVVIEVVLVAILGHSIWTWIVAIVHVYTVLLLIGLHAAAVTRPHTIDSRRVVLHGIWGSDIWLPLSGIRDARAGTWGAYTRTRWHLEDGVAQMTYGEATVRIDVDPAAEIVVDGWGVDDPPSTIYVTADEPRQFAAAIKASAPSAMPTEERTSGS